MATLWSSIKQHGQSLANNFSLLFSFFSLIFGFRSNYSNDKSKPIFFDFITEKQNKNYLKETKTYTY